MSKDDACGATGKCASDGKSFKKAEGDASARRRSSAAPDGEPRRVVRANDREFNAQFSYADNYIKTSKYNVFTFLPLNLLEQFQRLANFYFLILMCLQFIPQISAVQWYSTAIPLLCVLFVSAVKDGYDDVQRHKNDGQVNSRVSYIVRNGRLEEEQWMNVKVGDIVRMENEHFIPTDLFLLSSSEPYGLCYIETAELDGETNLKCRCALPETSSMGDIVADIGAFDGEIRCEPPNNRLHSFEGQLAYKGQEFPLDNSQMLLRGCRLRNTRWCYGLVVFAGPDTKLMMNSGETTLKRTSLDRFLNVLILGIVMFLFAMCFICMTLSFTWEWVTGKNFTDYLEWEALVYKRGEKRDDVLVFAGLAILQFFSYIILLNTVVPISLYISVEVLRFCHSLWINYDRKMYYDKTDTPAHARTTTLNEELGQVKYIFSDKTGTLTQNIMLFKKCSINGRSYGDLLDSRGDVIEIDENTPTLDFSANRWHEPNFQFHDKTLLDDTNAGVFEVHEFWRLLAICHTVMPERKSGSLLEYQAQSPDEAALTSAARNFGFVFKSRTPRSITIEVNGRQEVYEVLHILDFDNVRKRMSVIVRSTADNEDGGQPSAIKLYCKGADTMILDRLSSLDANELLKQSTLLHLDKFASDGLRTLCVAYRIIDEDYCNDWMDRQREASLDVSHKAQRLEELYEEIERDMTLLGATAIEDKLQDGVPQAIATLAQANIKIWVLTGDKTETAINIGYSCRLLTDEMCQVFVIDGETEREVEVQMKDMRRRIERIRRPTGYCNGGLQTGSNLDKKTGQFTTVIDGYPTSKYRRGSADSSASSSTHFLDDEDPRAAKKPAGYCTMFNWRCWQIFAPLRWIWRSDTVDEGSSRFYRPTPSSKLSIDVTRYIERQIEALREMEADEDRKKETDPEEKTNGLTVASAVLDGPKDVDTVHLSTNRIEKYVVTRTVTGQKYGDTVVDLEDDHKPINSIEYQLKNLAARRQSRRRYAPRRTSAGEPKAPIATKGSRPRRRSVFDAKIREPQLEVLNRSLHNRSKQPQPPPTMSPRGKNVSEPLSTVSDAFLEDGLYSDRSNGHVNDPDDDYPADGGGDRDDSTPDTFALVINGGALVHALSSHYEKLFLEIACMCAAVICCRVTPLQKAKVVNLVKRHVKAVTLAIGDGANDVSMIKTAHIGVGISGQEGMQAVLASDYSIGQFRYLERLLLVHGRWSYLRMSKFLRYFFYKNFSYTLTHFWYSFFCGYSAQTMYDPSLMACFNLFFTALPVLAMGVFDQDVNDEYSLRYPRLYIPGQNNQYFNMRIFVYSVIHGGVSSVVLFFIPYGAYNGTSDRYGRDVGDFSLLSFTVFSALVVVVNGQIMFDTAYWTAYNHLCLWGSMFLYALIAVLIYQVLPLTPIPASAEVTASYGVVWRAIRLPTFWLILLLVGVALLVPVIVNRFFWLDTRPSYADQLRLRYRLYPHEKRQPPADDRASTAASKQSVAPTRRSRRGSLRSGYAFAQATGFGELIAKGTMFRNLEQLRIPSFKHTNSKNGSKASKAKEKGKESTPEGAAEETPSRSGGFLTSIKESILNHLPGAEPNAANAPPAASKRDSRDSCPTSDRKGKRSDKIQPTQQLDSQQQQQKSDEKQQNQQEIVGSEPLANLQLTPRMTARHRFLVNVDNEPLPSDWPLTEKDPEQKIGAPSTDSDDVKSLSPSSSIMSHGPATTVVTVSDAGRSRLPSYRSFMAMRQMRRPQKVSPIRESTAETADSQTDL